jgi:hypothetical protein
MHLKVGRDLAHFGQLDHVHRPVAGHRCANGRTEIRFVSPSRLSRRWPGSANKTQPLDPAAAIAPILNHVPALAVGIDLLNSHGLCTFDARNERCQRALVIIHWRGNLRYDQKLRQPARIVGSALDIDPDGRDPKAGRPRVIPGRRGSDGPGISRFRALNPGRFH